MIWICEAPSHYNDFLFNAIFRDSKGAINLELNYMMSKVDSHPWKSQPNRHYPYRHYKKVLGIDWNLVFKTLRANRNTLFIIGGWTDPTAMLTMIILSIRRRLFVNWTDSPSPTGVSGGIYKQIRSLWIPFVFSKSTYILGTGKMALSTLKEMGCPEPKLINLPYFTDTQRFSPNENQMANEKLVFLSSGRLINSLKGFDLVIKALGDIHKENSGLLFEYRIAGTGPDLPFLEQLVGDLGLEKFVVFEGWLEPDELVQFYKQGDVFVHPAHLEPYGVAVIEAMASGLAIIGSNVTGAIVDRVEDGVNGYICEPNNVKKLRDNMLDLLMDKEKTQLFKLEARKAALLWPLSKGVEKINSIVSLCVE